MPVGDHPAGQADAERWRTFRGERVLVAVARTVTSTVRVLEVLRPVLRDDPRVHLVFAHDPGSAFNDGVPQLLTELGTRTMPWDQLPRLVPAPDLIVTATENADLSGTAPGTPVLVLPHGVGFHKYVPDSRSPYERLAGVVPEALLRSGRAHLAVSHPDQAAQLADSHPATAGRTRLVGDPCHDALAAGLALRERYRGALGVGPGRRLVLLSSTWRGGSVLGRDPALPARLLAELPRDEYAVALVTHPNVPSAHGRYELRRILDSAHAGGLLRIPPTAGWQATLCAADLLIGDHGSVTFYGAALGVPLLLGAFSAEEAVPGTPMAELGRLAPALAPRAPLLPQVERAIAEHDADAFRKLGSSALTAPGQSLALLREAVYGLLRLPAPEWIPLRQETPEVPVPDRRDGEVTAWACTTALTPPSGPSGTAEVAVSRTPAAVAHHARSPDPDADPAADPDACGAADAGGARAAQPAGGDVVNCRLLSACTDEDDRGLAHSASVLVLPAPARTVTAGSDALDRTLRAYPGCRAAAVPLTRGDCLVRLRDGRSAEASATGGVTDPSVLAAVVHAHVHAGFEPDGFVTLRFAGTEEDVLLRAW